MMKKQLGKKLLLSVSVYIFLIAGTACENPLHENRFNNRAEKIHANSDLSVEHENPENIGAFFNPQPEPPARIFEFETLGMPNGNWSGRFMNDYFNGRVSVKMHSAVQRGKTMHLVQEWILHPPDPIHPPEPIHPPDPIQPVKITMKGILNMANGKIVMNGKTETNGIMMPVNTNVHLRGEFTATGERGISVGGELMFNPQPEPPARRR